MKTILLTRASHQTAPITTALAKQNIKVLSFPTLHIDFFRKPDEILKVGSSYDGAIFVSPNAVYAMREWIKQHPAHLLYAAVGKGTKSALEKLGANKVLSPSTSAGSDALFEQLKKASLLNQKHWLLCAGEETKMVFVRKLEHQGAQITHFPCYRVLPPESDSPILAEYLSSSIDAVITTSCKGLAHLWYATPNRYQIPVKKLPLLVVGQAANAFANEKGFSGKRVVIESAELNTLIDGIQTVLSSN